MVRIMFVCHGNICRSPMAEFILKHLVKENSLSDAFLIKSSATSTEEIWGNVGNPIYPPARAELERNKIPYENRRAVLLKKEDYEKYDFFVGMDSANIRNMLRIFGGDPKGKVHKLMDYTSRGGDVADPWYSRNFDSTYRDIYEGCKSLLKYLIRNSD